MFQTHGYLIYMKQFLLGSLIKGKIDPHIQKGPGYDLTRTEVKIIVNYLKSKGLWTWDYMFETIAVIENEVLFVELQVLDPYIFDPGYQYTLEFEDVNNFLSNNPHLNQGNKHLIITARKEYSGNSMFKRFIDIQYHQYFIDTFKLHLEGLNVYELKSSDIEPILNDPHVKYLFDFDFKKYLYFLEYEDPLEFIIESDEAWFKLQTTPS